MVYCLIIGCQKGSAFGGNRLRNIKITPTWGRQKEDICNAGVEKGKEVKKS